MHPNHVCWYEENMHSKDSDQDGKYLPANEGKAPNSNDGWMNYKPRNFNWAMVTGPMLVASMSSITTMMLQMIEKKP